MARKSLPSALPTERTAADGGRRSRRFLLGALIAAALAVSMSGCVIFKSVSSSQLDGIGNVQITTTACASDTASDHTGYSPTDSACQGSSHGGNIPATSTNQTTVAPTLQHVTTGLKTDTTTTDPSFSFTVANVGSDRLLVVKLGENSATDNIAGVTYGGTALTALSEFVPGASRFVDHVFYLKNPPVGAANVVVDITAGVKVTAAMEQYYGVNQTTPFGTVATASSTGSTAPTVNVTGASGDLITDSLVVVSNTTIPTVATSPQTEDYEINTGATTTDIVADGSHQTATGTSTTMAHTLSASRAWSTVGFAIKPSQIGIQLKIAYRIPTAITAPSTITSTDPSGGSAITFTQNSDYTTQLTSLVAPGAGKKWVGYLSDAWPYTTAGYQYFTVAPTFALPQGSDGAPFQGPFNYRVVVGYRGVDQTTTGSTSSRAVTCGSDPYTYYADGSSVAGQLGICIDDPSSSTGASDLSQTTRDLGVVAGSPQAAQAGDPATVPFTLKYRGTSSPSFNLSASSNLPGSPTVTTSQSSITPATDSDNSVTASVTVPPNTTPGTYNVTFTATGTGGASGQNRSNTNTVIVGEAFGLSPSPALPSLGSITLNAQAQTKNATMSNFGVIDSPGSSDQGWNVTVVGDTSGGKPGVFKQYCPGPGACGSDPAGQYVSGGFSLVANSLTLNTSTGSWSGGTGTAPSFQCNAGGCGVDAATATKIASAPNGGGTGLWSATGFGSSSLILSTASTLRALPASEVYHLDAVWTLNSGP